MRSETNDDAQAIRAVTSQEPPSPAALPRPHVLADLIRACLPEQTGDVATPYGLYVRHGKGAGVHVGDMAQNLTVLTVSAAGCLLRYHPGQWEQRFEAWAAARQAQQRARQSQEGSHAE